MVAAVIKDSSFFSVCLHQERSTVASFQFQPKALDESHLIDAQQLNLFLIYYKTNYLVPDAKHYIKSKRKTHCTKVTNLLIH